MTYDEIKNSLLTQCNLNWKIEKLPLITEDNRHSKSFGLFKDKICLGVVKGVYKPLQNEDMIELLLNSIKDLNLPYSVTGGYQDEGRLTYLQLLLQPVGIENYNFNYKDIINRRISILNSNDGTMSIGFAATNTVVSCKNTFNKVYKEATRFKHTETNVNKLNNYTEGINNILKYELELIKIFKTMNNIPITSKFVQSIIANVENVDEQVYDYYLRNPTKSELSTRKQNQLIDINKSIQKEMLEKGSTAWGLFNGFTKLYSSNIDYIPTSGTEFTKPNLAFNTIVNKLELEVAI